jgi:uncharacterized repeat protein (TIGR01451 family)
VVINGGTNITFTPTANFVGAGYVTYTIIDGFGGTNTAVITINVTTAGVADVIVLMSGPTSVTAGNAITNIITVTNAGPSTATNVVLVDLMPTNVTYLSSTLGGVLSNYTVTWPTIPLLPVGGFTNYTLVMTTTNLGYITNAASASATTADPNLTNNNGSLPASQANILILPAAFGYAIGTPVFNPQTGLYEEHVTVTNTGGTTVAGMRVTPTIVGTNLNVILQNASGTNNGKAYVQYNVPLNPGSFISFVLEFLSVNRRSFTNTILVEAVLPPAVGSTNGTSVTITRIFTETYTNLPNRVVVEFSATPGRVYTIIYKDGIAGAWKVATPTVTATANAVQWIDSGPPKTESDPFSVPSRYYQVIQSP